MKAKERYKRRPGRGLSESWLYYVLLRHVTCLEYVEPVSVYHPSFVFVYIMSNTIHQPISPSTHQSIEWCALWVVCLVVPLNSSHPCLCVSPLCCITHTHVCFFELFLFLLWWVGLLAGCLLPAWPPPSLLCVIETLRPYLPDALAFIAAAICCFTRPPICYINHSCECFWLVVVCFCSYWYYLVSEFQCVSQSVCYTCLLAYLCGCASCASHFLRFETWAYVSFLFHVLGSAALRSWLSFLLFTNMLRWWLIDIQIFTATN